MVIPVEALLAAVWRWWVFNLSNSRLIIGPVAAGSKRESAAWWRGALADTVFFVVGDRRQNGNIVN